MAINHDVRLFMTWSIFLSINGVLGASSWWDKHKESISCVRPGYFVNPSDCHNFYRCVDRSTWKKSALQRYDFTCPSGMIFDPAVSVCTKPGATGCADPWWPGGGRNAKKDEQKPFGKLTDNLETESAGNDNDSGERKLGGDSFERLPSIFNDRQRPGSTEPSQPSGTGRDKQFGGGVLDDFRTSTGDSTTRPSAEANLGLFGSGNNRGAFSGNEGSIGDPLDAEFGSLPEKNRPEQDQKLQDSSGSRNKPGSGFFNPNNDPLDSEFGSAPGSSTESGPLNVPPFFSDRRDPESKTSADDMFSKPKGGDPLDSEFGSAPGGSTESGPLNVPSLFNDRRDEPGNKPNAGDMFNEPKSGDPLDAEFGSTPGSTTESGPLNVPPFFSDRRDPLSKPNAGDMFNKPKGGDPLDAEFGSAPGSTTASGPLNDGPSFFNDRRNPGSKPNAEDMFRKPKEKDPLDEEFRSSPLDDSLNTDNFNDTPPFLSDWRNRNSATKSPPLKNANNDSFASKWNNNRGSSTELTKCGSACNNNDRRKGQKETIPSSNESLGGGNWWGTNSNPPFPWDKNDNRPNNADFDNWDSGVSPQKGNKNPGNVNWGSDLSPSNPPLGESPWRPTGPPWGSGSSNDLEPESPQNSRPTTNPPREPSWWDPPFALPYRPTEAGPPPANRRSDSDSPVPWSYYRPSYPAYQVVAYPTWQYNRRPIIIVYSNSKR